MAAEIPSFARPLESSIPDFARPLEVPAAGPETKDVPPASEVVPPEVQALREERAKVRGLKARAAGLDESEFPQAPAPTLDEERRVAYLKWQDRQSKLNPGEAAEALRLAAATGHPIQWVADNLPALRKELEASKTDWEGLAREHPALAQFMLEDPARHALVKDDVANLTGLQYWLKGRWEAIPLTAEEQVEENRGRPSWLPRITARGVYTPSAPAAVLRDALKEQELIARQTVQMATPGPRSAAPEALAQSIESGLDPFSPEGRAAGKAARAEARRRQAAGEVLPAPGPTDFDRRNEARIAELRREGIGAEKDYGVASRQVLGRIALAPFRMAPMLAGNVVAATGGTLAGGPGAGLAAAIAWNSYENFGPFASQLSEMTGPDGKKLDPDRARSYAAVASLAGGTVMSVGLGPILRKLPGAQELLEKAGAQVVAKALLQPTTRRVLGKAAANYGLDVATGAAAMALQTGLNVGAEQMAKRSLDPTYTPDAGEVARATWTSFQQGVPDLLLLAGVGPAREALRRIGQAHAAAEGAARLEAMTDSARASALLQRAPEEFQRLVTRMKEQDGAVAAVYAPLEGWDAYWTAKNQHPREIAAAVLEDGGKAYDEARMMRSDLVMPVEKYLTRLATTEHAAELAENLRLSPEAPTLRQARAEQERLAAQAAGPAEAPGRPDEAAPQPPGAAAVREAIPPAVLDLMADFERSEHETATAEVRTAAEQELLRRITEHQGRENQAWFKDERARLEGEVHAELDADPLQRALRFLQKGEMGGGPEAQAAAALLRDEQGRPLKLDRKELVERYGPWLADQLGNRFPGIYGRRGEGAPVEDLAALLGFDSADELVYGLREAAPRDELVKSEVDRRLAELYGPGLLSNPRALTEAALDAVHTEAAAKAVLVELRALRRRLDPTADSPAAVAELEILKRTAQRILAEKPIAELSPALYLQAEQAAARRAFQLAKEGKLHQAYAEKEAQLLDQVLYREARDLQLQLAGWHEQLRRGRSAGVAARLGKADPVYRDAHTTILEAVGLLPEGPGAGARPGVDALVAKLQEDASLPAFDVDLLRAVVGERKRWKSLTPVEAQTVHDAVEQLKAAVRLRTELELEGRRFDRDVIVQQLDHRASQLPLQPKAPLDDNLRLRLRELRLMGQWVDAMLLDPKRMIHMLDGGETGPWHDVLWKPYLEAKYQKHELQKQFLGLLLEHWEKLPEEMKRRRFDLVPGVAEALPLPEDVAKIRDAQGPSTRMRLWMIALNMGNASNKERLLGGYGWSEQQVMDVLTHPEHGLTKEEWHWIQGVWDSLESLYPLIAEVHEKDTGVKPGKIEATPITLPDGEVLRGGYFPAKYDPKVPKTIGLKQEEQAIADAFRPTYQMTSVAKGHAKQRAEHYQDVVNLSWSVVPGHLAQVLHDVAFRLYVKQTAGLFLDPRVKTTLINRLGEERAKQFMPWLQSVANSTADSVAANLQTGEKIMAGLRNRVAVQAIGLSLPVFAGDLTAPLVAGAGKVRWRYLGPALAKGAAVVPLLSMRRFMLENSPEMRYREESHGRALRKQLQAIGGKWARRPGALGTLGWLRDELVDAAFVLQTVADKVTIPPVWAGAYQDARARGKDHAAAAVHADSVVADLTSSQDAPERPALLRDRRGWSSLLMFYGYMSKMLNLRREIAHEPWLAWHDPEASLGKKVSVTAAAAGKLLYLAFVLGPVARLAAGQGWKDDEPQTEVAGVPIPLEWLAKSEIEALTFADLPLIGGGAAPAAEWLVTGKAGKVSIRNAPALAALQSLGDQFADAMEDLGEEGDPDRVTAALSSAELLLSFGMGAPTRQAHKTLDYLQQLSTGDAEPRGSLDVAGGLIYGQRENQPANPPRVLQDVISGK